MSTPDEAQNSPYQLLTSTRYDPFLKTLHWNDDDAGPSAFFLLPLHLSRLVSAAQAHAWSDVQSSLTYDGLKMSCADAISKKLEEMGKATNTSTISFRLRITVSKDGQVFVAGTPLPMPFTADPTLTSLFKPLTELPSTTLSLLPTQQPPVTSPPLRIFVDSSATVPSIFTQTKTTLRDVYEQAKARALKDARVMAAVGDWDVILYSGSNNDENADGVIMETSIFNVAFYRSSTWLTPSTTSRCLPGVMRTWLLENDCIKEDTEGILKKSSIIDDEWVLVFNGVQGCRLGKICM